MTQNISHEKFTTIFIISALALITIILLLQALDINFSFSAGVKSALDNVNQSLNNLTSSINSLQSNIINSDAEMMMDSPYIEADSSMMPYSQECNLEGLTDQEIENLTDEELSVLCPDLSL